MPSCVDRDLRQHILATPLGKIILVIKATEFFYPSPVLIDLLFWFTLVIASGLFRPIANIIVVLHQAAQADCTLLCLLLYIKDQKKRQSVGY